MFQHVLREESIRINFSAPNCEAALAELIALLPSWGIAPRQKSKLLDRLLERERFGTTAVGEGVALPNTIFSGVNVPLASFAISRQGIIYPSLDGEPVNLLFLLILPAKEDSQQQKVQMLHEAESIFRDRFVRERLKIADSPEDVYEILVREGRAFSPSDFAAAN